MARLAVEGQRSVYYEVHGQGPTTMVLIHGWGMNSRAWDGVLLPLMDAGVRVVTLDHRGCGRSDHDFDDLSINSIAADVVRITKELSLDSVILNGWSLGGA
ncbi:MAG: alpha/beta hydrolase, partial [Bacteroidetes bacterium]|nr:alpha/beta hydrolase [Bacteroidota bacterium]